VKVTIECPGGSNDALRERARQVADEHPARSPERRAAAACWAVLCTTPTVDAARKALADFGSERTQTDAADLLGRLAVTRECAVTLDRERACYVCSACGARSEASA
jgi:hypothetical protein